MRCNNSFDLFKWLSILCKVNGFEVIPCKCRIRIATNNIVNVSVYFLKIDPKFSMNVIQWALYV